MRIDAHQHFWAYSAHPEHFGWMNGDSAPLQRDYLPDDLAPLLAESGFNGTVAVQARELPEETSFLLGLAAANPIIRGVVGWLDLCDPSIDGAIEEASRNPLLKGLRMLVHDHPDVDFAASEPHRRGVAFLARHGLVYDLLLKPRNLPSATTLVESLPNQVFVLDHIAKPDIAAGIYDPWRKDLARLAQLPNVSCKLSSLVTQADWTRVAKTDFAPALDWVLECFGPDRLMIGSDWPVCTLAAGYIETMGIVERWASRLSASEQALILGGTAQRVYRLG